MIRTINKVALYARFSSDNQRTESIDAQIRAMKDYCKKKKFVIVNTYIDEARSAMNDRRPSFQQMIADSDKREFNIVLVHKLDRFARNRYDSAVYKRELKKNGVMVYSVLENIDDSPESIMMESIIEGMAEYYSRNLGREVMKGMKETALKCCYTGGNVPLGFDIHPSTRKFIINEHEAETVRIIFKMFVNGYSYSAIVNKLREEKRLTKRGEDFKKTSLYSILTNMKYKGVYVFNKSSSKGIDGTRNTHLYKDESEMVIVEGGCPQIVDSKTFDKAQTRLRNNVNVGGRNIAKTNYLLSGKVVCMECGRSMSGNTRKSGRCKSVYVTYRCPSKRHACTNKEINRDYLEAAVVALLEEELLNTASMKLAVTQIENYVMRKQQGAEDEKENLQKRLEEVKEALANVADAVATGLMSATLIERLDELEMQKAEIESELLAETSQDIPELDVQVLMAEYNQLKNSPASPEYKELIRSYIRKIEVGRYTVSVTLKTGLDLYPKLDTTYQLKRQKIYEERGR